MTTAELSVSTTRRTQFISITTKVAEAIKGNGWQDGVITIFAPHTTAGVTINENADPDVARDMESFSNELVSQSKQFMTHLQVTNSSLKKSISLSPLPLRPADAWLPAIPQPDMQITHLFFCA